jgi:hypothetical protein
MFVYEYQSGYRGQQVAGWNIEPSAAGHGAAGVRFTSPGHAGGWVPLNELDDFADALRNAGRALAAHKSHRGQVEA